MQAATENRALIRAHSSMDSWALGVMAFELLSGEAVFDPSKMTIDDVRPASLQHRNHSLSSSHLRIPCHVTNIPIQQL